MINLNNIMIGTSDPKGLAEFYEKVLGKPADSEEGSWYGWKAGGTYLSIGEHSEEKGKQRNRSDLFLILKLQK